jgi:hypothetical protein
LDAEFLALIDRLGGVPKHGSKKVLEQVRQVLSTPEYRKKGFILYKDWRSMRRKFDRLQDRLAGVRRRPPRRAGGARGGNR